ncbi:MAG: ABC transporter substrate-binding protein [Chloroflexi bacterium]|nr:ABC transporter substrate-binding protein [Chloroflexota bacterium]
MRICSLLPSATEIVYALGLGDQLVGVSHACDFPLDAQSKPVVSRSLRQVGHLDSREIDAITQQARSTGNPLYWIDGELLRELRPDLIITQELCEVCAVGSGSVYETAAQVLDYQPEIITIRPAGVEDIFQNILNIGRAAESGAGAEDLVESLRRRMDYVGSAFPSENERPRVFCIDWLDPLRNTGQWGPELVELAGGEEGLADKWGKSREVAWEEVLAYQPEYLMMMPCAFEPERVERDSGEWLRRQRDWQTLPAVRKGQVFLFDGRIPSRHGPRIADVMEGLAEAMWPQRFAGLAPEGVFHRWEAA